MSNIADFTAQFAIWGWVCSSHEPIALFTSEHPDRGVSYGWWDRTAADLETQRMRIGDEPERRVPDYWALPGVTELLSTQEDHVGEDKHSGGGSGGNRGVTW